MHMHNLLKSAWKWPNDAPWGTEENVKVVVHILFFFLFFFFLQFRAYLGFSFVNMWQFTQPK